jgi:hypothetical protein
MIMRGSLNKEKVEKMLRGQSFEKGKAKFQTRRNFGEGKPMRDIYNVHF